MDNCRFVKKVDVSSGKEKSSNKINHELNQVFVLKSKTLPNKENLILKILGNNVIEMIHVIKGKNMAE